MALVTNQLLGSYKGLPSRSLSLNKGSTPEQQLASSCALGKSDKFLSPGCLRVGTPCFPKVRSLRIVSFKGNNQNDGGSASGSRTAKVSRNSIRLSDVPKGNEETSIAGPQKDREALSSHPTDTGGRDKIAGSPVVHKLFRRWVGMLTTPMQPANDQVIDDMLVEGPPPLQIAEKNCEAPLIVKNGVLKTLYGQFWSLDATVKIPVLVFIPIYVVVNVAYGVEVSKELTPFWVLGPPVVAGYVKMAQALCSLYAFTLSETAKVVKKIPVVYSYVFGGKLKEDVMFRVWQTWVDINNLDSTRVREGFKEWFMERYFDYIESIWPSYCRFIRALKRAHFI